MPTGNRLKERFLIMALTNLGRWVRAHGKTLTTDEKVLLRIAVNADIKKALKRPVKRKIEMSRLKYGWER